MVDEASVVVVANAWNELGHTRDRLWVLHSHPSHLSILVGMVSTWLNINLHNLSF